MSPEAAQRATLEAFWMPFTANRQFKAAPRLLARALGMHYWTPDGRHLLYIQDQNGDENWHVLAVDLKSKSVRDLKLMSIACLPLPGREKTIGTLYWENLAGMKAAAAIHAKPTLIAGDLLKRTTIKVMAAMARNPIHTPGSK